MEIIKPGRLNTFEKECERCGCIFQFNEKDIHIIQSSGRDDYGNLKIKTTFEIKCPNCSEIYELSKKEYSKFYK